MKQHARWHRAVLAMVAFGITLVMTMFLVVGVGAQVASAALNDTPIVQSSTNPLSPDPNAAWRGLWGTTRFPEFTLVAPASTASETLGMLYTVDRSSDTTINASTPNLYSRAVKPSGPHFTNTIDLMGFFLANPTFLTTTQYPAAASLPEEGTWYYHYRLFSGSAYANSVHHQQFNIDLTAPRQVKGVAVYATSVSGTPLTTWAPQNRVHVRWDKYFNMLTTDDYDKLSKTAYFRVYVDGVCAIPGEVPLNNPSEDGIGIPWAPAVAPVTSEGAVTLEDLSPGLHVIQVSAVDRATNEGPLSEPFNVWLNPGFGPTVSIVYPAKDETTLGVPAVFTAVAGDNIKVTRVSFSVDGVEIYSRTPSVGEGTVVPAMAIYAVPALPAGLHTLAVTATNQFGLTSTSVRTFYVDASLPVDLLAMQPPSFTKVPFGGTTTTNPYVPDAADSFWRQYWGTSLHPQFVIDSPSFTTAQMVELLYLVDRTPINNIDPEDPSVYYSSVHPKGTETKNTFDQMGIFEDNPIALDGNAFFPGRVTQPVEGVWFWHALYRDAQGNSTGTLHIGYGIDLTPPSQVASVAAYSNSTTTTPMATWVRANRAHIRWNNAQQDALSGTAYYRVFVDGVCVVPGEVDILDPASSPIGTPWYVPGRAKASLTLEDLSPGPHSIQVAAVDRAGNQGALSSGYQILLDPDVPAGTILNPATSGGYLNAKSALKVRATDDGGVSSIRFAIDGIVVGTARPSKLTTDYVGSVTPRWSDFRNGSHMLTATVTDMTGRTATLTRSFVLDKVVPSLSITSVGSNPFYPRLRDGYKDNYTVKFKTNEAGTASMRIYDSKGKLKRIISKSVKAGSSSLTWNGSIPGWDMDTADQLKTYKFSVKIRMVDKAGNKRTSKSYATSIKFYQIVKTGPDSAKIVPR